MLALYGIIESDKYPVSKVPYQTVDPCRWAPLWPAAARARTELPGNVPLPKFGPLQTRPLHSPSSAPSPTPRREKCTRAPEHWIWTGRPQYLISPHCSKVKFLLCYTAAPAGTQHFFVHGLTYWIYDAKIHHTKEGEANSAEFLENIPNKRMEYVHVKKKPVGFLFFIPLDRRVDLRPWYLERFRRLPLPWSCSRLHRSSSHKTDRVTATVPMEAGCASLFIQRDRPFSFYCFADPPMRACFPQELATGWTRSHGQGCARSARARAEGHAGGHAWAKLEAKIRVRLLVLLCILSLMRSIIFYYNVIMFVSFYWVHLNPVVLYQLSCYEWRPEPNWCRPCEAL
jgi:hypothetical protein